MLEELIKQLSEMIQTACEALAEFTRNISRLLGEDAVIKPYRCRACGRRYTTRQEVRLCMRGHQRRKSTVPADGGLYGKHAGKRIMPRNREATMRPTEIRQNKRSSGRR